VIRTVERERTLRELTEEAGGAVDILLTEGYKTTADARIEISRRARSEELISTPDELFALVTDNDALQTDGVPRFGLGDYAALVDLIESEYLRGGR
jgi:molybdopterin-guanine dinucleotide biosynthesis protein